MKKIILSFLAMFMFSNAIFAEEQVVSNLNKAQIQPYISKAFEIKSGQYTEFAQLFNLCQKFKHDPRCGEEYASKKANYSISKANHESLQMLVEFGFLGLKMPLASAKSFGEDLHTLGFLNITNPESSMIESLNNWLVMHDLPPTNEIFLIHVYMVSIDADIKKFNERAIEEA